MKNVKYTQITTGYLLSYLTIAFCTLGLILILPTYPANAQTNDPKLNQQYYIFDHNIDDAWNINKGSSNTRIAIHSMAGFTTTHEDMVGRYLNPSTEWFAPELDFASEVAGIVGANSNNSIGIAGIDWHSTLKSYNVLRATQPGDDDPDATFYYDGEEYYLDLGKLDAMVNEAIQDNMDIQLFTFGVPSAKPADYDDYELANLSGVLSIGIHPIEVDLPNPRKPFWEALLDMGLDLGEDLINTIFNNDFYPPDDLTLFREKIWEFSQPTHNGVTLAPSGDLSTQEVFQEVMPANFDNYVITVGGVELQSGNYIHWSNSQAAPYVDVAAAATDIVSIEGTANNAYNTAFKSTAAATGIVGGIVGLLKAENPNLTHDDIEEIMKRTALDLETPGEDDKTGAGFVDAEAALNFVSNNDVVQKTAAGNDISVVYNAQVSSETFTMNSAYLNFSNYYPQAQQASAKLKKMKGEIFFEYQFQQPPEVWLRMTSDGIDTEVLNTGLHIYDPFDKNFRVTSVTENSFTFELYYWRVSYYDVGGNYLETINLPNFNNLTIDYTAVGQETSLPPAPEIEISGLNIYNEGTTGYWDAEVEHGQPPYNIIWRRSYDLMGPWTQVGTGTSYSQTVTHDMYLKAKVTDANNQTDEASMSISVNSCSNPPCPMPKMRADEILPETFAVENNYPNPFNPSTNIKYQIPEPSEVRLDVYNILGRRIATLVNETQTAGFYTTRFDARNLASGVYIARLQAVGQSGEQFIKELTMQMIK